MNPTVIKNSDESPRLRDVLRWEAACVAAEMLGVAAGLYLLLVLQLAIPGVVALCVTAGLSFFVRTQHYLENGTSESAAR